METFENYIKKDKTKEYCPCCDGYGYVANEGEERGYDACYRCGNTGWVTVEGGTDGSGAH